MKTERPIRFFCTECGKEMWEHLDYEEKKDETIEELLYMLICSDCMMNSLKKEAYNGNHI